MDTKPIRIKWEGISLLAYRDTRIEGQLSQGGFDKVLRRLLIEEADTSKIIGCVVFYLGLLASYSWDFDEASEYGKEKNEEFALANLIPHLPIELGHLKETFQKGSTCLLIYFDKDEDGYKDDVTYKIKLEDGFYKTAQRLVFPIGVDKKNIEKEILQILLNALEENPDTYMGFEELQASIPLTTKALILNLNLLKDEDKIDIMTAPHSDPPKIISVKIKAKGIRALEGEQENAIQSSQMVKNIYGTNIENLTTHGDNSPINISTGNINTAFGDIIKQVEAKEFANKEETLELVDKLKSELSGNKNPKEVKTIMDKLKEKASWVYNLIFKSPVLTAYLTQLLLKNL